MLTQENLFDLCNFSAITYIGQLNTLNPGDEDFVVKENA